MKKIFCLALAVSLLFGCGNNGKKAENVAESITEKIAIEMIFVKGGTFTMGCVKDGEYPCTNWGGEIPFHSVTVSDFYIGKYPVTQKQWKDVMGNTIRDLQMQDWIKNEGRYHQSEDGKLSPEILEDVKSSLSLYGEGDDYPMYYVSWDDAQAFIEKLNSMTGKKYRLLTEAEWEYAARGGEKSKGYKYAGSDNYDEIAWYKKNSGDKILERDTSLRAIFIDPPPVRNEREERNNNRSHQVGTKKPNELGIYDMNGNVSEWVGDWWGEYSSAPQTNPKGPSSGNKRVIRGWDWNGLEAAVYTRLTYWQEERDMKIGFRLAIDP